MRSECKALIPVFLGRRLGTYQREFSDDIHASSRLDSEVEIGGLDQYPVRVSR
jgi:hypothetical protein